MEGPPRVQLRVGARGQLGEQTADPGRFRLLDGQVVLRLDQEQPRDVLRMLRERDACGRDVVLQQVQPLPQQTCGIVRVEDGEHG